MRIIREILLQALIVIVVLYGVQVVKYWIVGDVRPTTAGVIISLIGGFILSEVIVKKRRGK